MNNLNDFTKEQLVGLLQKANDRRKTVERNMRKYAQRYYRIFNAKNASISIGATVWTSW